MNDNKKKTKSDYKNTPREELIREISKAEDAKTEEEKEARKNAYDAYVSQVTPTYSLPLNMLKAFLVGGIICCIGQGITNFCLSRGSRKVDESDSGTDQCGSYRIKHLSDHCKIRWRRCTGSNHRFCEWCGSACY